MFFDNYPRFYETSSTAASRGRLNLRYEAIFAENADIFDGARVLDIASHDGRWSLAALATGAKSVIGIEPRRDLVEHANESLAEYGYGSDRSTFIAGDVFDVFEKQEFDVDVVICLGFLYHTLRYNELLHGIRRANPGHVIIDTAAKQMMGPESTVRVMTEPGSFQGHAVIDQYSHGEDVLIGGPNLRAIRTMMHAYGFGVERLSDWGGLLRDNPGLRGVADYSWQRRLTVRCADQRLLGGARTLPPPGESH